MIKLKGHNVVFADTPLLEGLYLTKRGSMFQVRLKEVQITMSAVTTFEKAVECGKFLVERYRTLEVLKKKLSEGEYSCKLSEQELIRRGFDEEQAMESDLHKRWYHLVAAKEVVETEVKISKPKKVKLKLK